MCGIAGVVDYEGRFETPQLERLTLAMRDTLTHRGPDDAGLWTSSDGRVCLAQRRLSIIDLRPEGRQPMLNEDGSVAVTFNGEIYNFQSLRRKLEDAGHWFASRTDTEVLCHLYEDEPDTVAERLSGMFAFAVWRQQDRELVLARDPFGKKPLYYLRKGAFLAFASELRALQLLPDLLGPIDPAAVQEYLLLQYIHAPRTIYQNVRKMEPGSSLRLRFSPGKVLEEHARRYFRFEAREPSFWSVRKRTRPEQLVEELRSHLIDATRDRLISDVPLGAFLSGGNDSSLVVAIMARELGVRVRTYSVGFTGSPSSEHHAARQIAQHLGTDHHELLVDPSAVDMLPTIVGALDEPNGDSSCLPVYLLCQFARRQVTVALSGDGGDEMFGGYGRYTDTLNEAASIIHRLRWFKHFRQWWTPARAYLGERILPMTEPTLRHLVGSLHPDVDHLMRQFRGIANGRGPVLHRLRTLDAMSYMPGAVLAKVDRMSMQFALEVRSPLLDLRLARWVEGLPARALNDGVIAKKLIKQLALRYLPEGIVNRPKQGFGVPDQCWSQDRLLDLADDLLASPTAMLAGHLDRNKLRQHLREQRQPRWFNVYQIWEMLVLEQWMRQAAKGTTFLAA
jgi:asparagine synthase (glutamine-hydrolysing)